MHARFAQIGTAKDGRPLRVVVGLAALTALLSASCCVLPIGLSIIGLGGSWLAVLGPFALYRVPILVAVGAVVFWAWLRIVRRSRCAGWKRAPVGLAAFASLALITSASSAIWEEAVTNMMWSITQ